MTARGFLRMMFFYSMATLFSCQSATPEWKRTDETEALLLSLRNMPQQGVMFGHHDDTFYGIGWEGDEGRSDVKNVCGDYPAVMSYDIGHIELGSSQNLDNISFDKMRQEIINQYNRGGMNTISWHIDNPKTGDSSWDVSDTTVVASILPGGPNHEMFLVWLDRAGDFLNSLKTDDGVKVPVLFRPWHEHTGSWFWWGQVLCTPQQYKDLWTLTYERMQKNGVDNILYAYSPGIEPQDTLQYLERYPGDNIVDVLGFDGYQFDYEQNLGWLVNSLDILQKVGEAHNKPIAITETGFETIPDSTWWTETLLPLINDYPISYVLVWRNAREKENHYYAPYPGQVSADNFVEFYNQPKTLFVSDLKEDLYR